MNDFRDIENKNDKKNIYMIDPNNTEEYVFGLLNELSKVVNVTYITKKSSHMEIDSLDTKKWFYSNRCKSNICKGINYVFTYVKILINILLKHIDVVHIQWCKFEKIDYFFINIMKKYTRVVYTAHNVLPHVNGEAKRKDYEKIYTSVDQILVHGESIKKNLISNFLVDEKKVIIQPYGYSMLRKPDIIVKDDLLNTIKKNCYKYKKVIMCLGLISRYKGTDRILKIWNEQLSNKPYLLVIAGKIVEQYVELETEIKKNTKNIILVNRILTDYEFDEFCNIADLIVLPYRNASMSGVVYAAARARTTVLATNSGSISEYLENGIDSIIVDNNESAVKEGLLRALEMDEVILKKMGEKLYNNFKKKYDWKVITQQLLERCY